MSERLTAQIFEIHMMMLEDDDYNDSISDMIESKHVNAEYAVSVTAENFSEMFASMDDSYMQARAADVKDISNRIIRNLSMDAESENAMSDKMIVCADDLSPSETILLDKDKVYCLCNSIRFIKLSHSNSRQKYEYSCCNRCRRSVPE